MTGGATVRPKKEVPVMKPKALVAMSGGVDSTVALALTMEAGYDPIGVTMKLHSYRDRMGAGACGSAADIADAARAAASLGVPHEVLDFSDDFAARIITPFIEAYEQGDTPNPCILCNRCMKFERLLAAADRRGCEKIVTGHYARVVFDETRGRYLLKKALAAGKDQSYVLYFLSQQQLARISFPLGTFSSKDEVRREAVARSFANAGKRDSQDICFVPDGDYAAFITARTGKTYPAGNFIDREGHVLGTHAGFIRYTTGQRKGLGIALGTPAYVLGKNAADNTVTLGKNEDLFRREMYVRQVNLIDRDDLSVPVRLAVRPRYNAKEAPATVYPASADTLRVVFDKPQRALTTGQAAVFYDGENVVGGGTICRVGE